MDEVEIRVVEERRSLPVFSSKIPLIIILL